MEYIVRVAKASKGHNPLPFLISVDLKNFDVVGAKVKKLFTGSQIYFLSPASRYEKEVLKAWSRQYLGELNNTLIANLPFRLATYL